MAAGPLGYSSNAGLEVETARGMSRSERSNSSVSFKFARDRPD